jgi:NADPH:quinone reductase-like Zn-dependent oxidoreductase
MRAAQWTSNSAGVLAETLTFNTTTPLPPNTALLPKDSTVVKVVYMSSNHIDYKLPETPMVGSPMFSQPTVPGRDFAGTVIATTLPGLKENDRMCGKSDPPVFGTLDEYVVIQGKEGIVKAPDNVILE